MKKLFLLSLGVLIGGMALAKTQIFRPSFFGGEYEFVQIDSMKKPNKFLPSTLYELNKEGQHIGYAVFVTGYTDYSFSYTTSTEIVSHVDRTSGNGAVYFLGATKQQALATIDRLDEIIKGKKSGSSQNVYQLWNGMKKGKMWYEEYVSMIAGYNDEEPYRVRYGTLGGFGTVKGVFISKSNMEPALLTSKELASFRKTIESYQEPEQKISWAGEPGNGAVVFSNPIGVFYVASSSWKGFGGSEMYLFNRDYVPMDNGLFADKSKVIRHFWTYTVEDPTTAQGSLLPLGDDIAEAIKTVDELIAAIDRLDEFQKSHKIWAAHRNTTPEGYIFFDDMPAEKAADGYLTLRYVSIWPELVSIYSPDYDTKVLATNRTVLKKIRKMLEKEQAKH